MVGFPIVRGGVLILSRENPKLHVDDTPDFADWQATRLWHALLEFYRLIWTGSPPRQLGRHGLLYR